MKAKTTKFLAVLAVLAMAFAGVAVLAQDQNVADAAVDGATECAEGHNVSLKIGEKTTYYTTAAKAFAAVKSGDVATITLLASHSGAGLQTGSGVTGSKVTIDFKGFTYTVNDPVGSTGTVNSGAQLLTGNEYTFKNGTLSVAAKTTGATDGKCYVINNYATLTLTDMVIDGTNLVKRTSKICNDPMVDSTHTVTLALWMQNGKVTINGSTTVITGTAGDKNYGLAVNYWPAGGNGAYAAGAHVTLDTTGEINGILMAIEGDASENTSNLEIKNAKIYGEVYTYASMANELFEIKGATVPAGKTLTNNGVLYLAEGDVLTVDGTLVNNGTINNAGTLDGTGVVEVRKVGDNKYGVLSAPTDATFGIADTLNLKFLEGAQVSAGVKIGFVDQYNDTHSFKTDKALTVQMGGFDIKAGENCIVVSGTALVADGATEFTFTGNALLTGTIYTAAPGTATTTNTLSIYNEQGVDVKVEKFQIAGPGAVTLKSSVLVVAGSTFNVGGKLNVGEASNQQASTGGTDTGADPGQGSQTVSTNDEATAAVAVLKVAEGAVVKAAGDITANGYIWNAGSVYAPATQGTIDDTKLVRVYMNSVAGTGLFYKGSVVYDGTRVKPLAVAYGAYLDMTGKSTVNITSGQTSVDNPLYKYKTMTIATFDNTIVLNVDYDNYYAPTIELLKKAYSGVEKSGKYATYRGITWNTADSAIIKIDAPEEYEVKLVDTITEKTIEGKKVPALSGPITSGIKLTDQFNRVITPDTDGIVKLVFGYVYTIEGANATSKYKFIDYFEAFDTLDPKSKTKATFTMVRGPSVYAIDVATQAQPEPTPKTLEFGVLQITEGYAAKIIVTVSDDGVTDGSPTKRVSEGQVFLYYKVEKDGQEIPVAFVPGTDKTVITGIYTNDNIYFRAPAVDFYKYQFDEIPEHKDATAGSGTQGDADYVAPTDATPGWEIVPAVDAEDEDITDIPTEGWTAVAGVTGDDGKYTATTGGVKLPIIVANDSKPYALSITGDTSAPAVPAGTTPSFTITYVKYEGTTQKAPVEFKFNGSNTPLSLFADEIITIAWDDLPDIRQTMEINGVAYTKNTEYTVSSVLPEGVTNATIKLTLDKIEYAKVKNSSTKDFTVTDGNFTNLVEKTKTVDKAVEAFNGTEIPASNAKPTLVTLVIEGQSVVSWTYNLWDANASATTPAKADQNVVGETAAINLADGYTIEVTTLNTIYNQYIVKTQPAEHAKFGDYSRVGHMGDRMFVYASASEASWDVAGVNVYYENPEKEGFPDYSRGIYKQADLSEDKTYWTYTMPAENVVLMIKEVKDAYDVTIVDQAGEQQGDKIPVARGTTAQITIPAKEGMTVTKVEATPAVADLVFKDGVATFTMPENDVTLTATYEESAYSKDVSVTVGQKGKAINVVLFALDGGIIGAGEINLKVWYTYLDEDGEISSYWVDVPLTYKVEGKTAYAFTDMTFIQKLGDNYDGAYSITGTFTLGSVQGDITTTNYTPVEA